MKFARVNDQRHEAEPGLSGQCLSCDQEMVAKCGKVKVWHWAHKGRRTCDLWWESETEWHRAWKGLFPESWQEVIHKDDGGEKHIADVKTDQGWVIEFQHSHLKPEERHSRDVFYRKIVWVVDGLRRKNDPERFRSALNNGFQVGKSPHLRRVRSEDCTLLREWSASTSPIFFDFGGGQILWWLISGNPNGWSYVAPFSSVDFIKLHLGNAPDMAREFGEFVEDSRRLVSEYESNIRAQALRGSSLQPPQYSQRGLTGKSRGRGRF